MATNLRSLDLNLLIVFEAVFEAGSITRAAEKLALSPSATSHALGRLRDACGDELFVRVGQGIAPTPVAQRIRPEVGRALDILRRALAEAQGFDPATSTRRFEIAIPHPVGPVWALAIAERVRSTAPGVVLRFDTRTLPVDQVERMRGGELDVTVDWMPSQDARCVQRKLFDDHLLVVARRGHPRAAPGMAMDDLRREGFVVPHPRQGPMAEVVLSLRQAVAELGLAWRLLVSEFLEVPFLVARSDLLGFLPASMAPRAVGEFDLVVIDTPIAEIKVPILMAWHETRRSDDGHRWLRELVAETIGATVTS
ncbi:LysR substrate-binding domain-containing protein [Falsiroseomonas oryziterrae]|uniref:LysR substrate-binding domain-containing protein n=1 Tax=Falsiroseomonas oryziterrae TaxID=2911368 RepID=UPI001F21E534|nr:LysR substrate-binding domain-containing protein [Roseomonas sp. NPKOSM-4]